MSRAILLDLLRILLFNVNKKIKLVNENDIRKSNLLKRLIFNTLRLLLIQVRKDMKSIDDSDYTWNQLKEISCSDCILI